MFRSLHMKLVLILVLMIVSVMAVVGTFLINSVSTFYLDSFYEQMQNAVSYTHLDVYKRQAEAGAHGAHRRLRRFGQYRSRRRVVQIVHVLFVSFDPLHEYFTTAHALLQVKRSKSGLKSAGCYAIL